MRLLILAAALLPATSAATPAPQASGAATAAAPPWINPNAAAPDNCPPISRFHAQQSGRRLSADRLADLPAADVYKTVYRTIDGCEAPIIAGYGVGARR